MATAAKAVGDFGIATECGLGRRSSETAPPLLAVHRDAADGATGGGIRELTALTIEGVSHLPPHSGEVRTPHVRANTQLTPPLAGNPGHGRRRDGSGGRVPRWRYCSQNSRTAPRLARARRISSMAV